MAFSLIGANELVNDFVINLNTPTDEVNKLRLQSLRIDTRPQKLFWPVKYKYKYEFVHDMSNVKTAMSNYGTQKYNYELEPLKTQLLPYSASNTDSKYNLTPAIASYKAKGNRIWDADAKWLDSARVCVQTYFGGKDGLFFEAHNEEKWGKIHLTWYTFLHVYFVTDEESFQATHDATGGIIASKIETDYMFDYSHNPAYNGSIPHTAVEAMSLDSIKKAYLKNYTENVFDVKNAFQQFSQLGKYRKSMSFEKVPSGHFKNKWTFTAWYTLWKNELTDNTENNPNEIWESSKPTSIEEAIVSVSPSSRSYTNYISSLYSQYIGEASTKPSLRTGEKYYKTRNCGYPSLVSHMSEMKLTETGDPRAWRDIDGVQDIFSMLLVYGSTDFYNPIEGVDANTPQSVINPRI